MTERSVAAERLAAFVEGRGSTEERKQVIADLLADPDGVELVAEVAMVRDAMTQGPVGRRTSRRDKRWGAMAALVTVGLASAAAVAFLVSRESVRTATLLDIVDEQVRSPTQSASVFEGWGEMRGEPQLNVGAQAFRLGVRLAEVRVARLLEDWQALGLRVDTLRGLIEQLERGGELSLTLTEYSRRRQAVAPQEWDRLLDAIRKRSGIPALSELGDLLRSAEVVSMSDGNGVLELEQMSGATLSRVKQTLPGRGEEVATRARRILLMARGQGNSRAVKDSLRAVLLDLGR